MVTRERIIIIILIFLIIYSYLCSNKDYSEYSEYCYAINNLIKDEDFKVANISNGKIILKNDSFDIIKEIPFDENRKVKISYINKENDRIFYAFSTMIDDSYGILIVDNGYDKFMDGIYKLDRIGGNIYYYDTREYN